MKSRAQEAGWFPCSSPAGRGPDAAGWGRGGGVIPGIGAEFEGTEGPASTNGRTK